MPAYLSFYHSIFLLSFFPCRPSFFLCAHLLIYLPVCFGVQKMHQTCFFNLIFMSNCVSCNFGKLSIKERFDKTSKLVYESESASPDLSTDPSFQ